MNYKILFLGLLLILFTSQAYASFADFDYTVNELQVDLNDTSTISGDAVIDSWEWLIDGISVSTDQNYGFTGTETTDYNVCLIVQDTVLSLEDSYCQTVSTGDITPPVTTFSIFQVEGTTDQNITLTCTDNNTGCKTINYNIDNEGWINYLSKYNSNYLDTANSGNFTGGWRDVSTRTFMNGWEYFEIKGMKVNTTNYNSGVCTSVRVLFTYDDGSTSYSDTVSGCHTANILVFSTFNNPNKRVVSYKFQASGNSGKYYSNAYNLDMNYTYSVSRYDLIKNFLYSGSGDHNIQYFSTDNSDNNETIKTSNFTIDVIYADFTYVVDELDVDLNDTSYIFGDEVIDSWEWLINDVSVSTDQNYSFTGTEATDYNVCLIVQDTFLSLEDSYCQTVSTGDITPPVTTFESFQIPNTTSQSITLTCTDNNSGCKAINYNINSLGWNLFNVTKTDTNTITTQNNTTTAVLSNTLLVNGYVADANFSFREIETSGNATGFVQFIYFDGTDFNTAEQTVDGTGFVLKTFTNTSPTKIVSRINTYIRSSVSGQNKEGGTLTYSTTPQTNYSFLYSGAGQHSIQYFSTDNSDNNETIKTSNFTTIILPVTTFSSFQVPNTTSQSITLTCTDNNTGCKAINYNINSLGWNLINTADNNYNYLNTNEYTASGVTSAGYATVLTIDLNNPSTELATRSIILAKLKLKKQAGQDPGGSALARLIYYYSDGTNNTTTAVSDGDTTYTEYTLENSTVGKDVNKIAIQLSTTWASCCVAYVNTKDLTFTINTDYNINQSYNFLFSGVGSHSIQYFSTDNSDNNETIKTSNFTTYGNARFNFIDENTYTPVTTTYTINPSINGISTGSATSLDLNLQGITSQLYSFQFSAAGYGTRFYYTDLNEFSALDFNQLMLQDANAANNITLKIYNATGTTLQEGTPVTITKANYLVGKYLTNGDGAITPFLADLDTNYVFNVEGLYTTSQRPVLVYRPKYDSNFADISGDWQITLTGPNSTNRYTITTNSQVIAILPNTETLYSAKICMLSGSVCSASYFSRTYLLGFKGLVGETSIQPYLNLVADSTLRTLKVLDYATNQPYPLAKLVITSKTDLGATYIVESLYTDSTGTAGVYLTNGQTYTITANDLTTYTIVPNAETPTYYIYFNFLVLPTETIPGLDVNTSNDFNGAEFFEMRNTLFSCSGTSDCFPSALVAIILTLIILVVATAVTVGNFIGVKGLSLIAFICFTFFFGIGWLPVYIFAFLGSITLLLLVVVQ